jgi:uncharacterized membrane protein
LERNGKKHRDKVISVSTIVFGHVPMAIVVMLFVPLPTIESVSYIILSALIHQGYQWYLISAYKIGDLTKVYPIARGTGPIIATLISIGLLGVLIEKFQIVLIILISFLKNFQRNQPLYIQRLNYRFML